MCKYIIIYTLFTTSGLLIADSELEEFREKITKGFSRDGDKAMRNFLIKELEKPTPRLVELLRRIEKDVSPQDSPSGNTSFYYSQIDKLVESEHKGEGVHAVRLTCVVNSKVRSVCYWVKVQDSAQKMNLQKWVLQTPANGSIIEQRDVWEKLPISLENLEDLGPLGALFQDPMPPTSIPRGIKQFTKISYIIEAVIIERGVPTYKWAIRSNHYTEKFNNFCETYPSLID
jgi:uncharacterized protein YehS (DUF1456 family)